MPAGVTDPNWKPAPGRVGNLTIPQQHALNKLKKELQDEGAFVPERMDDPTLLRFLRARKFDVVKAKEMLLAYEQWRKDFGVDDILQNFDFKEKEQVDKYYPQYYHKLDKDGRPIYIEVLGKLDVKALYAITTQERQLQRLVYEYEKSITERLPAASRTVGHPVETFCTIMDLAGVSLSAFYRVKDYVSKATQIGQDRYPETMGRFFIVNAPWGFSTVWAIVKPWLDPVTVAKIDVLGSGAQVKQMLLQHIPAESLPREYGGTCVCPGKGCSLSDAGPWNVAPAS
ncbi:CRAL-TRIO domain-containing protein [Vararia minispora EC-137]|uniref:CRAL-TRIO domain-containing protein n=1 Tax=Vararia minispora EC-137 TaxID=1314806 RepID=A0ACB8QIM5_9AGAM|nr:CRAL-TRIO domain-containing protein [Vararia minispora EC-137]